MKEKEFKTESRKKSKDKHVIMSDLVSLDPTDREVDYLLNEGANIIYGSLKVEIRKPSFSD